MREQLKKFGRWLNRLRWKSDWRAYIEGTLSYADFKDRCYYVVNAVRSACDLPYYSREKFDNGWQYRCVGHEDYKVSYGEMLNLIYGWW